MPEAKDQDLREARDSLVADIADHARKTGVTLPSVQGIRDFVDPIMRKVEVDSHDEAPAEPAPSPTEGTRERKGGEWFGEAEHSTRVGESTKVNGEALGGEVELRGEEIGVVKINKATGAVSTNIPMTAPSPLEMILNRLVQLPAWHAEIKQALALCSYHMNPPKEGGKITCWLCERREAKLLELLDKARREYGDERKKREKKIVVSG